jgi:hypothetical protein
MNSDHPPFSDPDFNPYAPPKAPIGEVVTPGKPSDLAQAEPMSRARCITSWLLGSASIILSLCELGLFANAILRNPQLPSGIIPPSLLAVVVGWLGLAAFSGCLGFWFVRAELRTSRPLSSGTAAIRICLGGLVCNVCDAMFLSIFTIYTWLR